jgi:integrase/recombinase XerD
MCLNTFWSWLIAEEFADRHPLQTLKASRAESPPIEPLSQGEVRKLLSACEMTKSWQNRPGVSTKRPTAERDKAIVWLMYDTGVRVSELCNLKIGNVDLQNNRALVLGKGNKSRYVRIGRRCNKAIWRYLTTRESKLPDDPFIVVYHHDLERPMNRRVLGRLIKRLGKRAEIQGRVYPHRLRHTFAIQFLRHGGDIYTLQALLGHTSLEMVKRYLKIAEADTVVAHRRASPGDHL